MRDWHTNKISWISPLTEGCQQPVRPCRLSPRVPVSWRIWTNHRSHVLAGVADGPAWWNPWWCWLYPGCTSSTSTASTGGSSASSLAEESPRGSYSIFIIKSWVNFSSCIVCNLPTPEHLPVGRSRNLRTRWVSRDRNIPPVVLRHRFESIFSREAETEMIISITREHICTTIYLCRLRHSVVLFLHRGDENTKVGIANRVKGKKRWLEINMMYYYRSPDSDLLYTYIFHTYVILPLLCPKTNDNAEMLKRWKYYFRRYWSLTWVTTGSGKKLFYPL